MKGISGCWAKEATNATHTLHRSSPDINRICMFRKTKKHKSWWSLLNVSQECLISWWIELEYSWSNIPLNEIWLCTWTLDTNGQPKNKAEFEITVSCQPCSKTTVKDLTVSCQPKWKLLLMNWIQRHSSACLHRNFCHFGHIIYFGHWPTFVMLHLSRTVCRVVIL